MMKVTIFLLVASFGVAINADYVGKYEDIDEQAVIANNEVILYVNCITGDKPCNPREQAFKDTLFEMANDGCSKCSPRQIELLNHAVDYIKKNYSEAWVKLVSIVDSEGKLKQLYE